MVGLTCDLSTLQDEEELWLDPGKPGLHTVYRSASTKFFVSKTINQSNKKQRTL